MQPSPPEDLLNDASLFLDFDGTLVELAETPDRVQPGAGLHALMHRLRERLAGRIAVISGRPAAEVHRLLGGGIGVVGSHGLEFSDPAGAVTADERPDELDGILHAMRDFARHHPGVLVEDKPHGAALHYRQCPEAEQPCHDLASELVATSGLQLQAGKMMVEVRTGGGDKGTAIRTLMREPGLAGKRPVFMGDDLTDEPGFVAAEELGGAGILVGEARPTAARYRVDGVEAALAWLEAASAEAA